MAKCLRCGAGSEWLEGKVKAEPDRRDELLRAVLYYADNPMTGTSLQLICDDIRRELKRASSGDTGQ